MVIYSKVENGKNVLYGTLTNIPSDADNKVEYKDADGVAFDLTDNDSYVDDGNGGVIRLSDKKQVDCYVDGVKVIPQDYTVVAEPAEKESVVESEEVGE